MKEYLFQGKKTISILSIIIQIKHLLIKIIVFEKATSILSSLIHIMHLLIKIVIFIMSFSSTDVKLIFAVMHQKSVCAPCFLKFFHSKFIQKFYFYHVSFSSSIGYEIYHS